MIVRRVLTGPIEPFDFFNDFNDTYIWLRCIKSIDAANVAAALLIRYEQWKSFNAAYNELVTMDRPHGEHPTLGRCDCDECQAWDRANKD